MKFYTLFHENSYFYFMSREMFLEATRGIQSNITAMKEEGNVRYINVMQMADFAIAPSPTSTSFTIKKNRAYGTEYTGKLTHCMALVEEFIYDLKSGGR